MHLIYPFAALVATALALPAQLVEHNEVQAVAGVALLLTPEGAQEIHEKRQTRMRHTSTARSSTTSVRPTSTTTASRTTSTSTRSSSTSSGASPTGTLPLTLAQRAVLHHNLHRRNHSAPDVTWDTALAGYAQTLAERCSFQHNTSIGGSAYGQNIAAGLKDNNITSVITDLWYGSEFNAYLPSYYGQEPDMSKFGSFGHFTQVVWSTTTTIGCFVADCSKTGLANVGSNVPPYLTVCNYGPPGNYIGNFGKSIGKPLGQAIAKWNTGLS